jgi:hypothetical protein
VYTITTPAAMSKIIFHTLITILFIADTGTMCDDVRLYLVGNLNASVCLLPSFLI